MSIENGVSERPHSSGVLLLRSENKQVTCVIKSVNHQLVL